jgi:hypothetical protein
MSKTNLPEITSYAGAASALGVGSLTMNDWAILVGILMAVLTFLLNVWYTQRKDQREQQLKELAEQELLSRIIAQGARQ